jgi:hypothetical protein
MHLEGWGGVQRGGGGGRLAFSEFGKISLELLVGIGEYIFTSLTSLYVRSRPSSDGWVFFARGTVHLITKMTQKHLAKCQFPDAYVVGKEVLRRPAAWRWEKGLFLFIDLFGRSVWGGVVGPARAAG